MEKNGSHVTLSRKVGSIPTVRTRKNGERQWKSNTIRVNGWGESEAEYNARRKIQKFHRREYEKITVTRIEKIK